MREELKGHAVSTVGEVGWSSLSNGELLRLAAEQFDLLLTADQNLQFQQNIASLPLSIVVLAVRSNKIEDLRPLVPELLLKLNGLAARSFLRISR